MVFELEELVAIEELLNENLSVTVEKDFNGVKNPLKYKELAEQELIDRGYHVVVVNKNGGRFYHFNIRRK